MKVVLFVFSAILLLVGMGSCAVGKTVAHEISGAIWGLMAVLLFVGAALLEELERIRKAVEPKPAPKVQTPPST